MAGTHWRKLVSKDSPHLHHWDIEGQTPLKVTIEAVRGGEVFDGENGTKAMQFLHFKGGKKALGLCVTNGVILEAMFGPHIEAWAGKEIVLRVATCKNEPCIRLQAPTGMRFGRNIPKFKYTDGGGANGGTAAATE